MAKKKNLGDDSQWDGVYKNALFRTEFLDWGSLRNDNPIILNTYTDRNGTVPSRALNQSAGHSCPSCTTNLVWNQGGPFICHHNNKPFGSIYSVLCAKCGGAYMMPHKYLYRLLTDMGLLKPVEIKEEADVPEEENEGPAEAPSVVVLNGGLVMEPVTPTVEVVKKKRGRPPKIK